MKETKIEYNYKEDELVICAYVDQKRAFQIVEFGFLQKEEPDRICLILCSLKEYVLVDKNDWRR